jgi:hypothetical protein
MNKLNKLVTVMAVTTITLGVNAGDMKKIGLANPNTHNLGYTGRFLNKQATNTRVFLKNIYLVCKCPAF